MTAAAESQARSAAHRAGLGSAAPRDADLGAFARLVGLGAGDQQPQAERGRGDVRDVEADQFGPAQRAGEAEQEKGAIPEAGEVGAAGRDQAFDLLGGERRRSPRGLTMGARDTTQGLADGRVPGIERLLGDAMRPGDGRDPAPQRGQGVAEAGGGEIGARRSRVPPASPGSRVPRTRP